MPSNGEDKLFMRPFWWSWRATLGDFDLGSVYEIMGDERNPQVWGGNVRIQGFPFPKGAERQFEVRVTMTEASGFALFINRNPAGSPQPRTVWLRRLAAFGEC